MSIDVSYLTTDRTAAASTTPSTTASNGELDKQAFLELLVTQLRNQDPSAPMDSSQLMTQTSQMSMMEALVELADTQREAFALQMRSNAAQLVGQKVTWVDGDGVTQSGLVDSVSYSGAVPVVRIGETELPLDAVSSVTRTSSTTTPDADASAGTGSSTTTA